MPAGRPPKPIEEHRLNGNPSKKKLPRKSDTVALLPADGVPPVPAKLAESGVTAWMRIWQSPAQRWLSPEIDHFVVERVCALVEEIEVLRAAFMADPFVIEESIAPGGQRVERLVVHSAEAALRRAEKQLSQELSSLGFNPTARARLGLAEVKRRSKVQELLERSRGQGAQGGSEGAGQGSSEGSEDTGEICDAEIVDLAADS